MQPFLIRGDCLEELRRVKAASVDMVFADPPYGTTANAWDTVIPLEPLWAEIRRVAKPEAAIVLMAAEPFTSVLITSNLRDFKYRWTWDKANRPTGFLNAKKQPLRIVEDVCVFYREQPTFNPMMTKGAPYKAKQGERGAGRNYREMAGGFYSESDGTQYPRDLIRIPADERGAEGRVHPTQKPVALARYMIETYTWRQAVVLDFCMGSGTTGVACARTRRNFIGIESDAEHFRTATRRVLPEYEALI